MPKTKKGDLLAVERYLSDVYAVFNKRLAVFVLDAEADRGTEAFSLQEMLREIIKCKRALKKS